ncbi:MAG: carboxypeptidase-like regulatory domain-containing protein, partial [Bacteroidales bacterium]|nr:carboxypeptidase-like regulatory domain-containing protein [Bacteroidales bacterium]
MARAQSRAKSLTLQLTVVSDTDKQPVAGAACMLTDYGIFAITDAEGRARLEKVPVGDATLSIQMLGFEDFTEMFRFRSDSTFTVRIQESTLALEEVVVTAKPSATGSSTSSNIGRMAIDHLQATSLKDVMQLIPGQLMSSSDMTSEAKITIRSASDNSANNAFGTSIMVDGVPVSDNTSLGTNAGTGVDLRQIS